MAKAIKDNMQNNPNVLVTTGGGSYLKTSLLDAYFMKGRNVHRVRKNVWGFGPQIKCTR
jgi:hypothetical protein